MAAMGTSGTEHQHDVAGLLPARSGHFRLESGHHSALWLDLELLCLEPDRVRPLAGSLARALSAHGVDVVCGPLIEGAFVALMAATALGVPFTYAERRTDGAGDGLFAVRYVIPPALRPHVQGRRVAVVNDVINAGSAVRGTLADLAQRGAVPVVVGTLAVLGTAAPRLTAAAGVALETLATLPNEIWTPRGLSAVRARRAAHRR
jgi:orotate phosphoribosyltransferase